MKSEGCFTLSHAKELSRIVILLMRNHNYPSQSSSSAVQSLEPTIPSL